MREIKIFKTEKGLENWIENNKNDYQFEIIFVNNAYGVEYKPLLKIEWAD